MVSTRNNSLYTLCQTEFISINIYTFCINVDGHISHYVGNCSLFSKSLCSFNRSACHREIIVSMIMNICLTRWKFLKVTISWMTYAVAVSSSLVSVIIITMSPCYAPPWHIRKRICSVHLPLWLLCYFGLTMFGLIVVCVDVSYNWHMSSVRVISNILPRCHSLVSEDLCHNMLLSLCHCNNSCLVPCLMHIIKLKVLV